MIDLSDVQPALSHPELLGPLSKSALVRFTFYSHRRTESFRIVEQSPSPFVTLFNVAVNSGPMGFLFEEFE
jgi:hypothetical protein